MTNKIKTVLITGGCGFVGSNLVKYFLENTNYNIRILDNLSAGNIKYVQDITSQFSNVDLVLPTQQLNDSTTTQSSTQQLNNSTNKEEPQTVTVYQGDIRNEKDVEKVVNDVDAVVHLAAITGVPISLEKPKETFQVNVNGTQNLLEACREFEVKKFVLASSNAAVGDQEPPMHEEMTPKPISPYGASKLAGEGLCRSYASSFGIQANPLRFANVYGPYSDHKPSVVMKFIRKALNGDSLTIHGDGNQTRDFIHAKDIARGILLTLQSAPPGELFHLGTGKEITINELASSVQGIAKKLGIENPALEHVEPRQGDIYRNYSDPTKAMEELTFKPKIKFQDGVEELARQISLKTH